VLLLLYNGCKEAARRGGGQCEIRPTIQQLTGQQLEKASVDAAVAAVAAAAVIDCEVH